MGDCAVGVMYAYITGNNYYKFHIENKNYGFCLYFFSMMVIEQYYMQIKE